MSSFTRFGHTLNRKYYIANKEQFCVVTANMLPVHLYQKLIDIKHQSKNPNPDKPSNFYPIPIPKKVTVKIQYQSTSTFTPL